MADPLIKDEIFTALEDGPITVTTHGEFRSAARVHGSSNQVKRALGSLIKDGVVRRHRPAPNGCTAPEQPITFSLR